MALWNQCQKCKFPENIIVFIAGVDYYSKYSENISPLSGNSLSKHYSFSGLILSPHPKALCVICASIWRGGINMAN